LAGLDSELLMVSFDMVQVCWLRQPAQGIWCGSPAVYREPIPELRPQL